MKKILQPKISMFSPFEKPFSSKDSDKAEVVVDEKIYEYMTSENTKCVAKCTPCQCCACR